MHNDGLLPRKAQIVAAVTLTLTGLTIFYFYCLEQGPMYWVAGLIADSRGYYSVYLAFLLSFFPFFLVQVMILLLLDRYTSLFQDGTERRSRFEGS